MLVAALFAVACAAMSIAFVAAHGGLEVPNLVAASGGIAVASASPGDAGSRAGTPGPSSTESTGIATPATSPVPSPTPDVTSAATPVATIGPTTAPSLDALATLPACPDHPGCYEYTIRRGDTLSTISDHWLIGVWILEALNPQVTDPSTIVVGQVLFLGRSPVVRLDACGDTAGCYLYVVRSGDRLSTIAGRYGTTMAAVLALNPALTDANSIRTGQTVRLPGP